VLVVGFAKVKGALAVPFDCLLRPVKSAEDYPVHVKVMDEFGNGGLLSGNVPVDILVFETPEGYRIESSRIFFKLYTADYQDVPSQTNLAR
jgi:hypothetical protein